MRSSQGQGPSRQNHYVPEWYQRGFIVAGSQNWVLDLSPPQRRPDGTPIPRRSNPRAPKAVFWEQDLYVTRFGEQFNDEVETVLFQGIDDFGAAAVRAFLGGDARQIHEQYQTLLSYMGAQKLRTPKGLDWIRSRYPALTQSELLLEMQHLRSMFGALWAESVHEIVSAEDSDVKFLITDHPVTAFNAVIPEDAAALAYPNDAPITWNGTQTLFPLDGNHLLILTHVPYAKDPRVVNPAAKRTNARHFGNALLRTDALLRVRRLETSAVIAVNAWLKARARRYIAAGNADWLHPEREQPIGGPRLAELLLPPKRELGRFGGEIHMGFKDGTFGYRDAYGRTSRGHEFVAKASPTSPPALENACPCGSGQTYGVCCDRLAPWERPPWDAFSLRERNLAFLRAIAGVLELNDDEDEQGWDRVQRTLSDEQVAQLHRISRGLWPESTDLASLLPRPGDGRLRAVYMGPSDPRTAAESFISLVPLFDQILVLDPFLAARNLRPEFDPVTTPAQHKQQFLKNVMFWLMLEPLIFAGKVLVFPDPGDLDPEFQRAMYEMAKERTGTWETPNEDLIKFEKLAKDDFRRSLLLVPDEALLPYLKKGTPDEPDAAVQSAIDYMRREAERDPLALLQVFQNGEPLNQALVVRSMNLELAIYIAQSTGAIFVTDVISLWNHLHEHTRAVHAGKAPPSTDGGLRVSAVLNPFDALAIGESEPAEAARIAFGQWLRALQTRAEQEPLIEALRLRLETLTGQLAAHNVAADVTLRLTPSTPPMGFESPVAQRLVVGFGRGEPPILLSVALFRSTEDGLRD